MAEPLEDVLRGRGAHLVVGTLVDLAGVTRAKTVPAHRVAVFCRPGVGVSPSVLAFGVDAHIAFHGDVGVVGDLRLRIDPDLVTVVDDGIAWAPGTLHHQDGSGFPGCPRSVLQAAVARAEARGITARTGAELEFVLTTPDGGPRAAGSWNGYGVRAVLDAGPFLADVARTLDGAGVPVEQVHAEYGTDQFEVSLAPADPLRTADRTVLARVLLGRAAARHGFGLSFAPVPFPGSAGNGAHLHLSLADAGGPLFEGGSGPHGLTDRGGHAVAGIVTDLPQLQAILAGSALSSQRLRPGNWAGCFACWGRENREAAVRLCAAGPAAGGGGADPAAGSAGAAGPAANGTANVELKCIDGSANPYLAATVLLGSALDGVERELPLPAEVTVDPAGLPAADRERLALAGEPATALARLAESALARTLLGDPIVDGTLAVRTHEYLAHPDVEQAAVVARQAFSC